MKKQVGKLSKAEQEKIELSYHQMKPEEFDELMHQAKRHSPGAILLPPQLIETLKAMAEIEGEPKYQTMVRKWIEERLQHEVKLAVKLSEMPRSKLVAILKRQLAKKTATRA